MTDDPVPELTHQQMSNYDYSNYKYKQRVGILLDLYPEEFDISVLKKCLCPGKLNGDGYIPCRYAGILCEHYDQFCPTCTEDGQPEERTKLVVDQYPSGAISDTSYPNRKGCVVCYLRGTPSPAILREAYAKWWKWHHQDCMYLHFSNMWGHLDFYTQGEDGLRCFIAHSVVEQFRRFGRWSARGGQPLLLHHPKVNNILYRAYNEGYTRQKLEDERVKLYIQVKALQDSRSKSDVGALGQVFDLLSTWQI